MRASVYILFFAVLVMFFSCESYQGGFDESVPELYTLTTNVLPEEGGTIQPSGGEFLAGEGKQIVARPSDGYVFDRWSGDLSGDSNPGFIQFNSNRSVTAHFSPREYNLNLEIIGKGAVSETILEQSSSVTVRLDADAEEEWFFDRWEGDLTGNSNPDTITIGENEELSIRAVFEQEEPEQYTLAISTEGSGTVEKDPDKELYTEGEEVRLTADAGRGWNFIEWQGDLSGSTNPETIIADSDKQVKAVFEKVKQEQYTLTISTEGSGTVGKDPDKKAYNDGDEITLTADAASGWNFIEWRGDLSGSSNPEAIIANSDKRITAVFEKVKKEQYTLTISTEGSGAVGKDPDKEVYTEGEEVTLTADAASGWNFIEWREDLSGSSNPEAIIANSDKRITAVFEKVKKEQYTLAISTEGSGTVDKDPDRKAYNDGDEITLTADAASGWNFIEWQGDLSGSTNPESIIADRDKRITAVFEQDEPEQYTLTISTEGSGAVDKDPDKEVYTEGEEVTLTADAALGWNFVEWQGDLSGSSNPESIIADRNKRITAVFEQDEPEQYTIAISTEGAGKVDKDPDKEAYTEGEEVTLTADAALGWNFVEWQGDLTGNSNPESIIADSDKRVTAVFEINDLGVTVEEVKFYIREMNLEGTRNTNDFKTKDFILNIPLNGSPFEITHVDIPRGFYDELELSIKEPKNDAVIGDPDFRDMSGSYSLVVKGTFDGVNFTFRSGKDFEIETDISPHLEIRSGQTEVIAITIDFEDWFMGENDRLLDPNDSRNREQIIKNIEDSLSNFEY